jgi:hypothetical protein
LPLFGNPTIPTSSAIARSGYSPSSGAEADLRAGWVPLQVDDAWDDDREPAVLGVELNRSAGARADGPFDSVRALGLNRRADDLPALEGELDADGLVRQGIPPP